MCVVVPSTNTHFFLVVDKLCTNEVLYTLMVCVTLFGGTLFKEHGQYLSLKMFYTANARVLLYVELLIVTRLTASLSLILPKES